MPYWAENDDNETCNSSTVSKTAGLAFWLCDSVVEAPSARMLLYGRLPLIEATWPGLLVPWLQLLPVQKSNQLPVPAVQIKDAPRYQYRGMMLDVSKYYVSAPHSKTVA